MKQYFLALIPMLLLVGCKGGQKQITPPDPEEVVHYANFMYNYPRVEVPLPNGNTGNGENVLYERKVITLGEKITAPETDPEREYYTFKGWFKEKECENEWDFDVDIANSSVFLFAKWEVYKDDSYVEPEYVYPEDIIEDGQFSLTHIFNMPVEGGSVNLTSGAIKRLEYHEDDDVSFAVRCKRGQDVTYSASYDKNTKKITVSASNGAEEVVTVNPVALPIDNTNYETKAQNYEAKYEDASNYHIMLAGSSSMEFWETFEEDMDPIVTYNTGIGGTTVQQWTDILLQRLVLPYSPKAVVYYVGVNNIINAGQDGETTGDACLELLNKTHQYLPNTQVFYVLINKLPGYMNKEAEFAISNNKVIQFAKQNSWVTCIDAGRGLLKPNGKPNHAYFRVDGLHMSQYGYVIWGNAIRKAITDWLG